MKYATLIIIVAGVAISTRAAVYYAAPDGTGDSLSAATPGNIYTAVQNAKESGDVVQLAAGEYAIESSPVTLSVAGITLKGADENDATRTILQGPGTSKSMTGLVVTKEATVCDLTLKGFYLTGTGGAAASGADSVARPADKLTARNCRIECNLASNSGRYNTAAAVYGGTWTNCVFNSNTNSVGNGGAAQTGTFIDCLFTNNTAQFFGGAVYKGTSVNCHFVYNTTTAAGGAGGAVYGGLSQGCEFTGNSSYNGGAGGCVGNDVAEFSNCVFTANSAFNIFGGALIAGKTENLIVKNCSFYNNEVKKDTNAAGGVANGGTFTDCLFDSNKVGLNGSGGALSGAIATRCVFVSNTARHGGGSYNTVANECVYTNNAAVTGTRGITGAGSAISGGTIKNCLIINNREDETKIKYAGTVVNATCINCTIVGNVTRASLNYGAAHSGTYTNCVVMGNSIDVAGGTHCKTLYQTQCNSPALTDCIQTDNAKFNKGAKEQLPYYYLRASSPARNAGVDVGWTAEACDLRGKKRICFNVVDLGCYEYQPVGFEIVVK